MLSVSDSKPARAYPAALSLGSPRPATGFAIPSPRPVPTPSPGRGEGLDRWFASFQRFEDTLGDMAVAAEEPKFKEELGTIEQWFRLLSESEQTATMYTLLQTVNYGQVKFLMAVLQQMVDAVVGDVSARPRSRSPRPPTLNLATPKTAHFNPTPSTPSFPTPAPFNHAQELVVEENTSWASMVNTPMDLMFKKTSEYNPKTPNLNMMNAQLNAAGMNANMSSSALASMGFSNETQMMAIQLLMSGMVKPAPGPPPTTSSSATSTASEDDHDHDHETRPTKQSKPGPPRTQSPAGTSANWRSSPPSSGRYPSSALRSARGSGLKSAGLKSAGLKSAGLKSAGSTGSGATPKEEDVDPELLEDLPAWLKSLRLHKYTPCFGNMGWREIIELDEPTMEKMGVVALGARHRLTKNFEAVKLKMGIPFEASAIVPASATVQASGLSSASLPPVPRSAAP